MWTLKASFPGAIRVSSILLAGLGLGLSGCSLSSSNGDSSIYVDLTSLRGASRFSLLSSNGPVYGLGVPPTSATGFSCYAVNVTGPGIGNSSPNLQLAVDPGPIFDRMLSRQSYCSYLGVTTPTFTLSASGPSSVALQVPPGGVRLIQITGVNDQRLCDAGIMNDPTGAITGNLNFEVGRAVLNDVFGDRSVDVAMDWPSTTTEQAFRQMDCGDRGCSTISLITKLGTPSTLGVFNTSGFQSLGFKLNAPAGKRLKRLKLSLYSASGTQSVTVEIRKNSASFGLPPDLSHLVGTSTPVNVVQDSIPSAYAFDLFDSAGNPIVSDGSDYWALITASASSTSPVYVAYNYAIPGNGTAYSFNSTSPTPANSAALSTSGVLHELVGCDF